MLEHFHRATLLRDLAEQQSAKDAYRLRLAAISSCRAVIEIMLEAAKKGEVKGLDSTNEQESYRAFEPVIEPWFPYYDLIERIRLHDFHRFGIQPPDDRVVSMFIGGPIKLIAQRGTASYSVTAEGPVGSTNGNSMVRPQRALLIQDGMFFDEESSTYVDPKDRLSAFLQETPNAITKFESLQR
jgi:hypothetical protein